MSRLFPDLTPSHKRSGGRFRELDVLARLRDSLPEGYDVYHSVALHTVTQSGDRYGEIDVLVLGPTGNILLMEVKAGAVILRNGDIFKLYGTTEHDIGRQCRFQYGAVVTRLKEAGLRTTVSTCLVIPDYTVGTERVLSIPAERIIDSSKFDQLGTHVKALLEAGRGCEQIEALRRCLSNAFCVATDLAALRDQLQCSVRTLSDGLATWVPRISSASRVIRVRATAGSGKTQLALRLIQDAVAAPRTVGYICYNRALADHIRAIAPARAEISTFHELAVASYQRHHGEPDFSDASVFTTVASAFVTASVNAPARFDVLVIDEGQDFEPEWIKALSGLLNADGYLYVMDDDDQRLYGRSWFDMADAVTVTCRDNYRSPRSVCDVINALGLASSSVRSMNDFKGEIPGFYTYNRGDGSVLASTEAAVTSLLSRGFALHDIAVITYRGRTRSECLGRGQLGRFRTRQFTGEYGMEGQPLWTDGDLLVDSLYRYKGQSAPAVVLTEVDFDTLLDIDRKRLFVGMTRAQMALEIVLTQAAEQCMMAGLAI